MRLVLLALLLLPTFAHAGPVIPYIAGALGVSAATATIIVQVAITVALSLYGSAQQKRQARKAAERARNEYNAGLQDRTITRVATEAPYRYAYGRAKVGSDVVAILSSGGRDEYKHLVCIHAAHECDAIEDVYINGVALGALDADGYATSGPYTRQVVNTTSETFPLTPGQSVVTVTLSRQASRVAYVMARGLFISGQLSPDGRHVVFPVINDEFAPTTATVSYEYTTMESMVRVKKHLGTPGDPADASLLAEVPSKWASAAVLRGFCYTVIRLNLNQPEFQGGLPSIEVLLRGKKLLDPRTGTTAWSQNNALVIYDYLRSEICGVDAEDIPLDQVIAAANACDEVQSFGPRYTFNGTVTSDQQQSQVLERMAQSMAGGIVSTTWDMYAGKYVAPVMALDQTDIVGQIGITSGVSGADLYNGVRGQYISAETNYVATDFTPLQNAAYLAADGRDLYSNIDFPFTDSVQRVHNLSRIFVEDQRNGYTIKAEFSLKAWPLKIGQRVTFTSARFGWPAKVFRVTDKKFSPDSAVELTLKEDDESIWDFADAVTADSTPNTNLPNPFAIDKLASLTCTSGTNELLIAADGTIISRIHAVWPQATTQAVLTNGLIEIEWQVLGALSWEKISVSGDETEAYLSPVEDGQYYAVRVRAVNPYLNVKSDWTYAADHMVLGKTEPPPNITDLSISGAILNWTAIDRNVVKDLDGYVFRFHYGNNRDWGSAVPLHTGVISSSPFDLVTRPGGTVTIMGKAVDTSGNESLSSGNIVTNLGEPPIANVVEEFAFHTDLFPGSYESCSLVAGVLEADALDSFYGLDSQSFYGLDNDSFYADGSYAQMQYTTSEISAVTALAGSVMTLQVDSQGVDLFIEYRLAGPGPFYGADTDSFYGADSEPLYGAPGAWVPWPGQIIAANDVYQFRVTIGAGATQGKIAAMTLTIDAPDIVEYLEDVPISAAGTVVPYTSAFTRIKTVTSTLQANSSGAVTVEVDKTTNLSPVLKAYNASHVAVGGATSDVIVKGY